jgi:predicted helicase
VRGEESQIQSLSNDYIKFLRFGEWQTERTGVGILGMITGHGYLLGTQPRDLRHHLSQTFDRCYCLDLHGSVRRTGTEDTEDEPVFQIMTGVAIIIGIRTWKHTGQGLTTFTSLAGRLQKKFAFLAERTVLGMASEVPLHRPTNPYFHFAASQTPQNIVEEYYSCLDLPELFGTGNRHADKEVYWATGFASQQDDLAMSFTRAEVEEKMDALAGSRSFDDLKKSYRVCTTDRWDYGEAKKFAYTGLWRREVSQVAYRPFDRRWTILHKHVLTIPPRKQVMSQLRSTGECNLGLISSRAVNDLAFAHCFVTNEPADKIFIFSKTSTNAYVFPLFFHHNDLMGEKRRPNFSPQFLTLLAKTLGSKQVVQYGIPESLTPEVPTRRPLQLI